MTTTLISISALIVSVATFALNAWYRTFRGPKLRIDIGDRVRLYYSRRLELRFDAQLTVLNNGAQYGSILQIVGKISDLGRDHSATFTWRTFVEAKDIGIPGESSKPWTGIASPAKTILVPGLGGITESIGFGTDTSFTLLPGIYKLEFMVYGGNPVRVLARRRHTLSVSDVVARRLELECVSTHEGVAKESMVLRRNTESRTWRERLLARFRLARAKASSQRLQRTAGAVR